MGDCPINCPHCLPPWLVRCLDWTVNLLLLSSLCVLHWRGTWQLLDRWLLAGQPDVSGLASAGAGYLLCCLCYWTQGALRALISDSGTRRGWRLLASRGYTVLFAFGLVNLWRGVWLLVDHFTGRDWPSGAGSTLLGVALLAALRALRNVMAPPLGMATDHMDAAYTYSPTRFRTKESSRCWSVHSVDVVFSVVVVGSLIVFVWRGVWTLLDIFLYPESKPLSAWSSLAMGYVVVLLCFCVQPLLVVLSGRLSKWPRVALEDVFISVACFGAINVWRGVWCFADVYILPNDPVLSNALTSVVGMLGSILLFAGNNILARGVYLDGENTDGSGCVIWESYLLKVIPKCAASVDEAGARLESVVAPQTATTPWKANGRAPWKKDNSPKKIQAKDGFAGNDVALLPVPRLTATTDVDNERDDAEKMVVVEKETVL